MKPALLILAFMYACSVGNVVCHYYDTKKQLISQLLADYDSRIRPVDDQYRTVDLDVSLSLFSINGVDEVKEKLTTTGFLRVSWQDEILTWDSEAADISAVYLKQVRI
jgi:hypothetical protein